MTYIVFSTPDPNTLHISTREFFDTTYGPSYEGAFPYNEYAEEDLETARANAAELVSISWSPYYNFALNDHTL